LTPVELLARLDPRLPLLTGGPRDLPARQQTLRATLEWSFEMLDEEERRDLIRLAVFAGGCTLEAAEAVCGTTVDRLASLVDHNLLRRTATADGSRYEMLETIREFALERLDELPDGGEARRRHSDYFLQVAKRVRESDDLQRLDEPGRRTIQMLSDEIGNYRAALEWLLARGDVEVAAEIAVPLTLYWFRSAQPQEAVIWLKRLLENEAALAPATRARVRSGAGSMLEFAGDREGAHELYEQALRDARASGDEMSLHITLRALGGSALARGEMEKARALLDESLSLSRISANPMALTLALATRGFLAREEADREGADRYFQEALVVAREHRTISLPRLLQALADFALEDGDIIRAAGLYRESLATCVEGRMAEWIPWALGGIATTAAERGDLRAAGRLWGAGQALEQQRSRPISRVRDQYEARIRSLAKVDPAAFEAAVEEGHRLPTNEAIREALDAEVPEGLAAPG
jgi:tetratricopeptide (TPR) repeat protein